MWSAMPNEHFDKSVAVSDQAGRSRIVSDTMQAAEILLRRFPGLGVLDKAVGVFGDLSKFISKDYERPHGSEAF